MKNELISKEATVVAIEIPVNFQAEFLENKYAEVEKEVQAEVFDVTTEDGRKRIKAIAADINKSKSTLDEPIRAHLRIIKAQPKVLEKNARDSKQRFEKLREGVLEPLSVAQKFQDDLLTWLNNVPTSCSAPDVTSETLNFYLAEIEKIDRDAIWAELKKKFKVAIENATTTATVTLERVEQQEKQAAELEVLRKQQAEAEKKESDRLVAEAAAKKATEDAERKASQEKQDAERRAVEAKQREEEAKQAESKAVRDAEIAEEKRKQEAIDNKKREEQALIDAKKREEEAAEKAAENERVRLEEVAAQEKQDALDRADDKKHRSVINRSILVAMIALGFTEEEGKRFITVVANKQLPDIRILY